MKRIIFLFFILSTFNAFAHKSNKNETKILLYDKDGNITTNQDHAIVLKAIQKQNDTTYIVSWYKNSGPIQKRESYKDSLFTIQNGRFVWYDSFGNIDSTGCIINGLREGEWQYYNCTAQKDYQGLYIDNIVKKIAYKNGMQIKNPTGNKPRVSVLIQPSYYSGRDAWLQYLQKKIKKPLAIITDKAVVETISFNIDKKGNPIDIYILNSLGYLYDSNVLNVIKKSRRKWRPAIQNGAPIDYRITQRIAF